MRTCFTSCDLSKLTDDQRLLLETWCRGFSGNCVVWDEAGKHVHIDLECYDGCPCAAALAPWRDDCGGWSKSMETRGV